MTMELKGFGLAELKALDEKGQGQAVIATLNTPDRDDDITHPGAFGQQYVKILQAHNWTEPSIGDAKLYEVGDQVIADFALNLNMQKGREVYESLKWDNGRHKLQEWSYGFQVLEKEQALHEGKSVRILKKVKAFEISPVVVGAGLGTGTLVIKSADPSATVNTAVTFDTPTPESDRHPGPLGAKAISPHGGATHDGLWRRFVHQTRVKAGEAPSYYHALYALWDGGDSQARERYRGLHHFVLPDGSPGPASVKACVEIFVQLHQGLYAAHEREGVYQHIAHHLKDAGLEPLRLGRADEYGVPLDHRLQVCLADVDSVIEELIGIHDVRQAKGLALPEKRIQNVQDLRVRIDSLAQMLHLKDLGRLSDVVETEQRRQRARQFSERVDATQQQKESARQAENTARALALQQRLVEREKRLRA